MRDKKFQKTLLRRAIVATACLIGFGVIAYFVCTDRISQFDDTIRYFAYSLRSPLVSAVLIPITYLGNWQTITGLSVLFIIIKKTRFKLGFSLGVTSLTSELINKTVKKIVKRARPDKALHIIEQGGYSFPSGHSMTGLVFYGMMIYALRNELLREDKCTSQEKLLEQKRKANVITGVIGVLIFLIGFSRIYVGVHYPSDVLGGWCLGTAFLMIAITVRDIIEKRACRK